MLGCKSFQLHCFRAAQYACKAMLVSKAFGLLCMCSSFCFKSFRAAQDNAILVLKIFKMHLFEKPLGCNACAVVWF